MPTPSAFRTAAGSRSGDALSWLASRTGSLVAVAALVALGWALGALPAMRTQDLALQDAGFALLRQHAPLPVRDDIVVVGLDEATLAGMPEPIAASHRTLGRLLAALAAARPRAVGLDIILPDRSFDGLAPGADQALIGGLLALRRVAPIVLGTSTTADGHVRPIHPPLRAAAGATEPDFALLPQDEDGRIRRFDDRLGEHGEAVSTLVGRLAAVAGAAPRRGLIQYALGDGFDYVPMRDVLAWHDAGDTARLASALGGRIVLVGSVLPHEDRKRQPVPLARWEDTLDVPGVLVQAQALRTQLAGAAVQPAPWPARLALFVAAAALWLVPRWKPRAAAFAAFALAATGAALLLLRHGVELPLGAAARIAVLAVVARSALEGWRVRHDRARLRALFGGYVSPGVLAAILEGRLDEDAAGGRRPRAFLFADLRGFTAMSERLPPDTVFALLNRYFAAVTPAVHEHGGTIDNFRGDGLMAIFGAPNPLPDPASAAILAARAIFARLEELNRELAVEGTAPLAIGVSVAWGEAIVGNVGSRDRYNYTAIGDAANVAARLQDSTKTSGFPLVVSAELVAHAHGDAAAGWTPLPEVGIRGHAPVAACGWRPAAPGAAGAPEA